MVFMALAVSLGHVRESMLPIPFKLTVMVAATSALLELSPHSEMAQETLTHSQNPELGEAWTSCSP